MTRWSRWFAGATLSTAVALPAWGDAPSAATLPPAPMPDGPAAPPLTPIPSTAPVVPYSHPYSSPAQAPRSLAPATQAWVDQAYPASPGGYPAYSTPGAGPGAGVGPFWAPGGYEPRIGSPYYYHDPNGGQFANTGNPYYDHYGPGFHRHSLHGHYRFPYYTYRAPWYYPGRAVYNRDTNQPW